MPSIIRQALSERIRQLPELQEFLQDFRAATGVAVEFVGPLGTRDPGCMSTGVCVLLQKSPAGCRYCASAVQQLLESPGPGFVQTRCDAGLWESAVPLKTGGQTFGFLRIGGYFTAAPDLPAKNRIRHLLERLGAPTDARALDDACTGTPVIDTARHAALGRILTLAVRQIVLRITDNLVTPGDELPPLVAAACKQARMSFTHEVSLRDIAKGLGVSTAHLCRVFHHSTGLRFREYLGRLRADYARELLLTTDRPVTEIALAAGFQSISQFNRVFRTVHGTSPQSMRTSSTAAGRSVNGGAATAASHAMLPRKVRPPRQRMSVRVSAAKTPPVHPELTAQPI